MLSSDRLRIYGLRGVALAAALMISGLLVFQTSRAAFTDTTDNTGNSLTAGTVTLVDDDSAAVLFNVSNMKPGDTSLNCILVTYQGSITNPTAVRIYSGGYTDSSDLANWLNITIEEGTPGAFGSCGAFVVASTIETGGDLIAFGTAHTNYANGAGVWDPSGTPESKTYRITLALDAATPNSEQGASVTALSFVWEVQSN
jgi:hypothetical protein